MKNLAVVAESSISFAVANLSISSSVFFFAITTLAQF